MKRYLLYMFLGLMAACQSGGDHKTLSGIAKLPSFKILSVDSTCCFSSDNFQMGQPTVLLYFDPDCEHCQQETRSILANMDKLKGARICLVTNGEASELKKFSEVFRLDSVKNVLIGKDYNYSFYRAFLPPTVPYMAIYNGRKDLVKVYSGETDIHFIIDATRE